jgi:uncharacterized protein YjbJ (UPF0337 family)
MTRRGYPGSGTGSSSGNGEPTTEEAAMSDGKYDRMKGRAKEAAGDLTDDDDLEREGKVDKVSGWIKDKVGRAADKAKGAVNRDR